MINIAICDDDKNVIMKLKGYLDTYEEEKCTVTTYNCGEDLIRGRKSFNIIFLDISMTGMDGIETAKKIRDYDRNVKIKAQDKTYILKEKIAAISRSMNKYGFLAPHKSFVVNLFYVKSIRGYDIFMMDGSVIPLSQKKSVEFREQFNIFLEKHI